MIGKSSLFSKLFCAQLSFAQSSNILMERPSLQSFVFKNHKDLSECQYSCPMFEDNITRLSVHKRINIPKAYWQMGDGETLAQSARGHRGLWKYFLQIFGVDPNFHFSVSLKQLNIFFLFSVNIIFLYFCQRDITSFIILIPKPIIICVRYLHLCP